MPAEAPEGAGMEETQDEVGMPEAQENEPKPMGGAMRECCVPLQSLALPDEKEAMEAPAVGDAVQFNCEGKVTRIEGDNAYVELSAVNGHEMPEPEEAAEPSEEEQLAGLEAEAAQQPDRYA